MVCRFQEPVFKAVAVVAIDAHRQFMAGRPARSRNLVPMCPALPCQDWLTSIEIKYYESKVNLNWKNILKSIKEVRRGREAHRRVVASR